MSLPVLPYRDEWTVRCPFCESLGTEYHPGDGQGLCHGCGRGWVLAGPKGGAVALPEQSEQEWRQGIADLVRNGLVTVSDVGGRMIVALTSKGREWARAGFPEEGFE